MVTVEEEAERKLRRRGAMRSHLVAVFLTACVSLSAMEAGADAPRPDPPEAPPIAAATPPQAAAAAVEHAAPAGSPADAAANAPAETMEAECMPTSDSCQIQGCSCGGPKAQRAGNAAGKKRVGR